jgi:hypothetical protein
MIIQALQEQVNKDLGEKITTIIDLKQLCGGDEQSVAMIVLKEDITLDSTNINLMYKPSLTDVQSRYELRLNTGEELMIRTDRNESVLDGTQFAIKNAKITLKNILYLSPTSPYATTTYTNLFSEYVKQHQEAFQQDPIS